MMIARNSFAFLRVCKSIAPLQHFRKFSALTETNLKLANDLLQGNRAGLARAITLIESSNETHQKQATEMLNYLAEHHLVQVQSRIELFKSAGHEI